MHRRCIFRREILLSALSLLLYLLTVLWLVWVCNRTIHHIRRPSICRLLFIWQTRNPWNQIQSVPVRKQSSSWGKQGFLFDKREMLSLPLTHGENNTVDMKKCDIVRQNLWESINKSKMEDRNKTKMAHSVPFAFLSGFLT